MTWLLLLELTLLACVAFAGLKEGGVFLNPAEDTHCQVQGGQ